jgi:hypothetical protein
MIPSNSVLKAHVAIDNVVIGNVTTVTTRVISITVSPGFLAAGDGVLVTCREPTGFTARLSLYAVIVDSTHIGLCIPNPSAADVDPVDTFDFDFYVFSRASGVPVTGT